jgi:hypothetical protein
MADNAGAAFRTTNSGLFVPAELSRERQVWTKDEARLLERATKLLEGKGIRLFLGCMHDRCREAPIERMRAADGGLVLRCAHADRVLSRSL